MSVTDEIKARLDLVAYISENGVTLKKAGRNFKALCPFHQERTPSFVVFPDTQNWRCFGACSEGGDIFTFAMKMHGWDFSEALRVLAKQAGVELAPRTPEQAEKQAAFEKLLGLLDETARFFHEQLLQAPVAEGARAYVAGRGLTEETVERFLLGYAPDGWRASLSHLSSLGYSEDDIVAAGVAIRNEKGRVYDRFRDRLMIPIRDGRGRVIGFGARAMRDEDQPKYLNSPQGDLFDKSRTLYGLDTARRDIRETETAIIVEGYMDVMQAYQAGFRNIVAQMGTALTEPQLQMLRKYASRIILALDSDQAGINATMRGLDVARQALDEADTALLGRDGSMRRAVRLGIDMRVLVVTAGKDPDDLIRQDPDEWRRLVENAEPVADFVIRMGTADLDPRTATVFEKEKVARTLLPLLTATESDLHKETNVQKLALALHLPERRLMEIALESRAAIARPRPTNPRFRERRRTTAMDQAVTRRPRVQPPPPRRPKSRPEDGWQEGPPLDYDALPVPEEDEEAADYLGEEADGGKADGEKNDGEKIDAYSAPLVAAERPKHRPLQAKEQERYCLGMLLQVPELLYQIERILREIATDAISQQPGAERQTIQAALSALGAEDFRDPVHQIIFRTLQEGLSQDKIEPLEYTQTTLDESLRQHVDTLLTESLEAFLAVLPANLRPELPSIIKQLRKAGRAVPGLGSGVIDAALDLRRERLRRICDELYFLIQEEDDLNEQPYEAIVHAHRLVIVHLDRALKDRAHLAHDG